MDRPSTPSETAGRHSDPLSLEELRRRCAAEPDNLPVGEMFARRLAEHGRRREAAAEYHRLGVQAFGTNRLPQAAACWRKSIELNPDSLVAHLNLGKALRGLERHEEAIAVYRRAIDLSPECVDAWRRITAVFFTLRRYSDAEKASTRWLELDPDSELACAALAQIYERTGRVREAYATLEPLMRRGTANPEVIDVIATVCARLRSPSPEVLSLIEQNARRGDLEDRERERLLKALADLCDALGRYDEAFEWLEKFKSLRRRNAAPGAREMQLGRMTYGVAAYTAERLARLPRASHGSQLPVFIVGMPRSGTTLTEQILSSHSRVGAGGELTTITRFARVLGEQQAYPACLDALTQARVDELAAEYLQELRGIAPQALRVTDKMPFNFQHLGLIEVLFPQARVVHVARHPLDCCVSCYFNNFPRDFQLTCDLATLGRTYRRYRETMTHWRRVSSLPIFHLQYEALLAEPERVVRELLEFCGLPWEDACLRFHESGRVPQTPSYHQVRKPLYTASVGRHRYYEKHLGPLVAELGEIADEPIPFAARE